MTEKENQQEPEAAGRTFQRKIVTGARPTLLPFIPHLCPLGPQPMGWCCPQPGSDSHPQFSPSRDTLAGWAVTVSPDESKSSQEDSEDESLVVTPIAGASHTSGELSLMESHCQPF